MEFEFKVKVSAVRESGKFATRDEVAGQLIEAIEGADPGSVDGVGADSDTTYSVESFEVEEIPRGKR